jgi:hypothetical protein
MKTKTTAIKGLSNAVPNRSGSAARTGNPSFKKKTTISVKKPSLPIRKLS